MMKRSHKQGDYVDQQYCKKKRKENVKKKKIKYMSA